MLPPSDFSRGQCGFDWWKFSSPQITLPEQPVYRSSVHATEKHAPGVHPLPFHIGCSGADKYRPRCTKRYQLMGIHRQINRRQRSGIANEITRKPMVSSGGSQVLDLFTQYAAQDFGAPGTRRTNESC